MGNSRQSKRKVSVVIASYNKAIALQRTLTSIVKCNSEESELEVIVVDDGSTDNTNEVCNKFDIKYVYLNRPGYLNPGFARNVGYKIAKGDVIINQSDEVEHRTPYTIKLLSERLTPGNCVFATVLNVDSNGNKIKTYCGPRRRRPLFFLGALWKKDLYAVGGNDEDFIEPAFEDNWLAECLKHLGRDFVFCHDIIGFHWDHPRHPNSRSKKSKQIYDLKMTQANNGTHPWTARSGPWKE